MAPRLGTAECLHCGATLEHWDGADLQPVWCPRCVAEHCCTRHLDADGRPHCVHASRPKDHRRFARACITAAVALLSAASCGTGASGRSGVDSQALRSTTSHRSHVLLDGGRDLADPTTTSSTEHVAAPRASRSTVVPRAARPQPVAPAPPPITGGYDIYDRLAACESAGDLDPSDGLRINPRAYNPSGPFYGAFQFLLSTWHNIGGTGDPRDHSYAEQKERVVAGIPRSSWHSQFPHCSRAIGA